MRLSNLEKLACLVVSIGLCSCTGKVERLQGQFPIGNQEDPALSANGEKLALIVDYNGKSSVQLRDIRNGKILPLRHLSRNQPHTSPSLSANARYLAVIAQRGNRRVAMIEDRLTGRSHQLRIPGERIPVRLSLAPDASRLALQIVDKGKWRIQIFDLTRRIEADKPSGSLISTDL